MSFARPLVDMRTRPTFLHKFFGGLPGCPEFETVRWLNRRVGANDPDHFRRATDLDTFLAEMTDAGIGTGIMVGRSTPTVRISNDALAEIVQRSKGRLLGIASIDPLELGEQDALAELRRAIGQLDLSGLNVDAGFYEKALLPHDDRLMPLYEACSDMQIPVCIMSGPTTPDLTFNDPFAVDIVARTFPKLKIICCHGFYPRVADMIAVAFRNENVFVSPDMYTWSPGGRLYIEAANGFMRDQLLFGSSYPFRPMRQGVEDLGAADLTDEAVSRVGWENAEQLFKIGKQARHSVAQRA
ncbi:amidohydrolase family protein [Acidiphilium iwatense]|uniref:Amidohydrolase family protein n=2 Tax=Acidiphilium iwatense TaxID=768198 RepID=A0ABS9E0Q7_9PROT|nr:amidohydrolase family protein [Acidiphilium iwatense]